MKWFKGENGSLHQGVDSGEWREVHEFEIMILFFEIGKLRKGPYLEGRLWRKSWRGVPLRHLSGHVEWSGGHIDINSLFHSDLLDLICRSIESITGFYSQTRYAASVTFSPKVWLLSII